METWEPLIPYSEEALRLFTDGTIALAEVEANGIKIDVEYLAKAIARTERRIKRLQKKIKDTEVVKIWRQTFKTKTNFGSNDQLGRVLFEIMDYDCPEITATGKYKTDMKTLSTVENPFVKTFLEIKKLQKAAQTYLPGFQRHTTQDGFIHPSFNLQFVKTYRSSSDSPNFQNIPVRVEDIRRLVRRAIVSRDPKWHLVEIDYGGLEVKVIGCQSEDPNLVRYIKDPGSDMHRDMAMECYLLEKDEVTKDPRYCAKNQFVFPTFYGSYWRACAGDLWKSISTMNLTTASGTPLKEHLAQQGIHELGSSKKGSPRPGTFEAHIQKVEQKFWKDYLPVHAEWVEDWIADYQEKGWFQTKTGFICQGLMSKNDLLNYPIQGPAFHMLLWSLIRLQNEMRRLGMKGKLCGQIHDSIVSDIPHDELDDYIALAKGIMVDEIREAWSWIIVPLEIDVEVAPRGGSWVDKEVVEWG